MNEKAVDLALKVAEVTQERDDARAELARLRSRDEVVRAYVSQRTEFINALRACVDQDADYFRWQGHAESRRHLAERLGDEVPS